MKMTYVPRVQGNMKGLKTIYTTRATSRIIDGSYNSIYKGRSMNFDELREYVVGDDIKDVDWKASARSQKMLVRQYIAEKKHNIMLILDTNRRMLAGANELQDKKDVAIFAAGTLACMVSTNGDYVGSAYMTGKAVRFMPFKTGLINVENILAGYDRDTVVENVSEIEQTLEYVLKNIRRKMIMLIITDMEGVRSISEGVLRQLKVMHDILLICVDDVDINGRKVYDMTEMSYLPAFISEDKKIAGSENEHRKNVAAECRDKMKKAGVTYMTAGTSDGIDEKIAELLGRHRQESNAVYR